MPGKSKVTVIGLCYNQESFLEEALNSVWNQTYQNVQLIIVDDGSVDGSKSRIKDLCKHKTEVLFIDQSENTGNCKAFNEALKYAQGEYIIDFSLDDVLQPNRIERQVQFFESLAGDHGVIYSNARYIDHRGAWIKDHFASVSHPPQGEVYKALIATYFIPTPTMMVKKCVFDELGGYDSALAYEDFDFWVRSARKYKYAYQPEILTSIRKHQGSLSRKWYRPGDPQLHSTYLVCKKIRAMNCSVEEDLALVIRLKYEIRQSVLTANHAEAELFIGMLAEYQTLPAAYQLMKVVNRWKLDLRWLMKTYQWVLVNFFRPKTHLK